MYTTRTHDPSTRRLAFWRRPRCKCICIYIYLYISIYINIHTYTYTHYYVYIHIYKYIFLHTYIIRTHDLSTRRWAFSGRPRRKCSALRASSADANTPSMLSCCAVDTHASTSGSAAPMAPTCWCVTCCDMIRSCVWHDSFMCETWLTQTPWHLFVDALHVPTRFVHMCDLTDLCMWYVSFVCVTRLTHTP